MILRSLPRRRLPLYAAALFLLAVAVFASIVVSTRGGKASKASVPSYAQIWMASADRALYSAADAQSPDGFSAMSNADGTVWKLDGQHDVTCDNSCSYAVASGNPSELFGRPELEDPPAISFTGSKRATIGIPPGYRQMRFLAVSEDGAFSLVWRERDDSSGTGELFSSSKTGERTLGLWKNEPFVLPSSNDSRFLIGTGAGSHGKFQWITRNAQGYAVASEVLSGAPNCISPSGNRAAVVFGSFSTAAFGQPLVTSKVAGDSASGCALADTGAVVTFRRNVGDADSTTVSSMASDGIVSSKLELNGRAFVTISADGKHIAVVVNQQVKIFGAESQMRTPLRQMPALAAKYVGDRLGVLGLDSKFRLVE